MTERAHNSKSVPVPPALWHSTVYQDNDSFSEHSASFSSAVNGISLTETHHIIFLTMSSLLSATPAAATACDEEVAMSIYRKRKPNVGIKNWHAHVWKLETKEQGMDFTQTC